MVTSSSVLSLVPECHRYLNDQVSALRWLKLVIYFVLLISSDVLRFTVASED